jgi:putative ATP-dependent endonuclease of OLD family
MIAMLLTELSIKNFRGIDALTIPLEQCTVLIGENNTGKTSILEAVHTCLSRNLSRKVMPFGEYDFRLTAEKPEPSSAPPIELDLTFVESDEGEWSDAIVQGLDKALQIRDDNKLEVRFRIVAAYDAAIKDFTLEWSFLDLNNAELTTARNPRIVAELQQLNPAFFLEAVRDAEQHFKSRSPFWGPFTKSPQMDEKTRLELEGKIESINQSVLDAHTSFNEVKTQIAKVGSLVPLAAADLVSVEAVPARIFDMLSKTQVKLTAKSGVKLPIAQHGAGTQNLSVLFLFEAFLNARLAEAYDKDSEPILALEEPESHLHPAAVRSLWDVLSSLKGQKIIATHSGELLATVPLRSIRRLARKAGRVKVFQVQAETLSTNEERKIAYHVRAKRGNLLFAKSWLLVEGESEFWFLPEAARLLGYDFEHEGVCCVEFAQCDLPPLIKLASDLGIEWHVLVDGDQAGQDYAAKARAFLGDVSEQRRITVLPQKDIEQCLWHHGYSQVYLTAAGNAPQQQAPQAKQCSNGQVCQWVTPPPPPEPIAQTIKRAIRATSKPHLAVAVVDAASQPGSPGLPQVIQDVIATTVTNAQL